MIKKTVFEKVSIAGKLNFTKNELEKATLKDLLDELVHSASAIEVLRFRRKRDDIPALEKKIKLLRREIIKSDKSLRANLKAVNKAFALSGNND